MANTTEAVAGMAGGHAPAQGASHSYAENVRHARNNFFVMLLAQLYCLITIETTQDAALLSNSTTQKLPILETAISIETFYILAPFLLLLVFFHFQIHLKSIWRSANRAAARENADLLTLVDTFPWFITSSLARRFATRDDDGGGFSGWFEYVVGLTFGWFSTAVVIFMMWARFLTKHDWRISTYHAALVALAICAAVYFLYSSRSSLRGARIGGWGILSRGATLLLSFLAPMALLLYATWWLFEAQDRSGCQNGYTPQCSAIFLLRDRLKLAGLDPAAALDGADVSVPPEGWAPRERADLDTLRTVRGANLKGEDLRYASAKNAMFVRADLRGATLRLGDFEGAWFQGADLSGADMSFSSFVNGNFDHAIFAQSGDGFGFTHAQAAAPKQGDAPAALDAWGRPARRALEGETVFDSADFSRGSFFKARLVNGRGADALFSEAVFIGAEAQGCWFSTTDFRAARFDNSAFTGCDFVDTNFFGAVMRSASLAGSRLVRVNLTQTDLASAVLKGVKLHDSVAVRAVLSGADLYQVMITKSKFDEAKLDDSVLSEAVIEDSSLRDTVFRKADLRRARIARSDLSGSDFSGALMFGAVLDDVDMAYVRLGDADLSGADLSTARNLRQSQLDDACGDRATRLPAGLKVTGCAEKLAAAGNQ